MKKFFPIKIIGFIIKTVKSNILLLISLLIFYVFYTKIFEVSFGKSLILFLFIYGSIMSLNYHSGVSLARLKKANALTTKKLIFYSLLYSSPIYLFWILFSIIPLVSYLTWFVIGLPLIVLSVSHFRTLYSEYWKNNPLNNLLVSAQILIYILCLCIGQIISKNIF